MAGATEIRAGPAAESGPAAEAGSAAGEEAGGEKEQAGAEGQDEQAEEETPEAQAEGRMGGAQGAQVEDGAAAGGHEGRGVVARVGVFDETVDLGGRILRDRGRVAGLVVGDEVGLDLGLAFRGGGVRGHRHRGHGVSSVAYWCVRCSRP